MVDKEYLRQLYTPKTLATLGGASAAVVITSGVAGYAFDFNPRWLGLLVAEGIAFLGLLQMPKASPRSITVFVVTILNGLVIYSNAVGLNALNHATKPPQEKDAALVPFLDPKSWWPSAELIQRIDIREAQIAQAATALDEVALDLNAMSAAPRRDPLIAVHSRRITLERETEQQSVALRESVKALEHAPPAEREALQKKVSEMRESNATLVKRLQATGEIEQLLSQVQQIDTANGIGALAGSGIEVAKVTAAVTRARAALASAQK